MPDPNDCHLADKKVDHLILLVGGNPLPNMVAAALLLGDGAERFVTLIHTVRGAAGAPGTGKLARRLAAWLRDNKKMDEAQVHPVEVDEADAYEIESKVAAALSREQVKGAKKVGLHYTGGTKAMAVHAYRAVVKAGGDASFSYLNPNTLELCFDRELDKAYRCYVGDCDVVSLKDLVALHNALSFKGGEAGLVKPILPQTARKVAELHNADSTAWRNWLDTFRKGVSEKRDTDCTEAQRTPEGKPADESQLLNLDLATLPGNVHMPEEIKKVLWEELGLGADEGLTLGAAYDLLEGQFSTPKAFHDWLFGKWLEHLILDALLKLKKQWALRDIFLGVKAVGAATQEGGPDWEFEVDVLAVRGYQLFAFSCTTSRHKGTLKLKLFEAALRAQQLGGDEARTALVCLSAEPHLVEGEMQFALDRPVRVFGVEDLPHLDRRLDRWLKSEVGNMREGEKRCK